MSDNKKNKSNESKPKKAKPPMLVPHVSRIEAAGNKPKIIKEVIGRVNTNSSKLSLAHMKSPSGWVEPGQVPEFDEYTYVLHGTLRVEWEGGMVDVREGQAILAHKGSWIRYSSPAPEGAEYIAVCLPAFSPDTVHRDS